MTKPKYVAITGGSGFIGSHLCDRFLAEGYYVTAIDNLITGRSSNLDAARQSARFSFLERDVARASITDEDLPFLKPAGGLGGVLHFACPASPVDFDRIPFTILEVDSIGTIRTVELAHRHRATYVLASTSEIYGDPEVHPQREEYWGNVNTIGPRACYDEAKRFAEAYVTTAARERASEPGGPYDLDARIVRIFNTYGPRMRPDDGRVVPELIAQALRGHPLTVHGDGKQTRSFCFVSDLVDGIFRLYSSQERRPVNLGNPVEYSVLEFAEQVSALAAEITGRPVGVQHLPGRTDDPKRRCPDISRAEHVLGWRPQVSLDEGLRRTVASFREELRARR